MYITWLIALLKDKLCLIQFISALCLFLFVFAFAQLPCLVSELVQSPLLWLTRSFCPLNPELLHWFHRLLWHSLCLKGFNMIKSPPPKKSSWSENVLRQLNSATYQGLLSPSHFRKHYWCRCIRENWEELLSVPTGKINLWISSKDYKYQVIKVTSQSSHKCFPVMKHAACVLNS